MKIKAIRPKEELSEVLMEPTSPGPDTAYWVFEDISQGKWRNLTILVPGKYGQEYPKTYGHYHTADQRYEASKLISGEGVFVLQKKYYDETGKWIPNRVAAVYFVKAYAGDEVVYVPKEFAHSWSNTGELPLMTYDDWIETGEPTHTYNEIKDLRGLAYYLTEGQDGQITPVPNPSYDQLPEPRWVSPEEFNSLSQNN